MIVRGDEVTLTKNELGEVIVDCSAKYISKYGIDDSSFIIAQALITVGVVKEVNKKIFGEENND